MSAARVGGLASNQLYRMGAFNFFQYREGPLGYLYASLKLVAGRCIVRLQCRWSLKYNSSPPFFLWIASSVGVVPSSSLLLLANKGYC